MPMTAVLAQPVLAPPLLSLLLLLNYSFVQRTGPFLTRTFSPPVAVPFLTLWTMIFFAFSPKSIDDLLFPSFLNSNWYSLHLFLWLLNFREIIIFLNSPAIAKHSSFINTHRANQTPFPLFLFFPISFIFYQKYVLLFEPWPIGCGKLPQLMLCSFRWL